MPRTRKATGLIVVSSSRFSRPSILVRSARAGLANYRRVPYLCRLFVCDRLPPGGSVLRRLKSLERAAEEARRSGEVSYSFADHVGLLTAIMGEYRLASPPAEASATQKTLNVAPGASLRPVPHPLCRTTFHCRSD